MTNSTPQSPTSKSRDQSKASSKKKNNALLLPFAVVGLASFLIVTFIDNQADKVTKKREEFVRGSATSPLADWKSLARQNADSARRYFLPQNVKKNCEKHQWHPAEFFPSVDLQMVMNNKVFAKKEGKTFGDGVDEEFLLLESMSILEASPNFSRTLCKAYERFEHGETSLKRAPNPGNFSAGLQAIEKIDPSKPQPIMNADAFLWDDLYPLVSRKEPNIFGGEKFSALNETVLDSLTRIMAIDASLNECSSRRLSREFLGDSGGYFIPRHRGTAIGDINLEPLSYPRSFFPEFRVFETASVRFSALLDFLSDAGSYALPSAEADLFRRDMKLSLTSTWIGVDDGSGGCMNIAVARDALGGAVSKITGQTSDFYTLGKTCELSMMGEGPFSGRSPSRSLLEWAERISSRISSGGEGRKRYVNEAWTRYMCETTTDKDRFLKGLALTREFSSGESGEIFALCPKSPSFEKAVSWALSVKRLFSLSALSMIERELAAGGLSTRNPECADDSENATLDLSKESKAAWEFFDSDKNKKLTDYYQSGEGFFASDLSGVKFVYHRTQGYATRVKSTSAVQDMVRFRTERRRSEEQSKGIDRTSGEE